VSEEKNMVDRACENRKSSCLDTEELNTTGVGRNIVGNATHRDADSKCRKKRKGFFIPAAIRGP
jgi:hypothetical protein